MKVDYAIIVFILGTSVLVVFAFTLVSFLIVHKKKQYRNLLEKQQMENNYQNQLLLSRLEVQEQSFRYFSEEMHDNVGQVLSIAKMQLYNIKNNSKEKETVAKAAGCSELLGKAIHDLRNISHAMSSTFINKNGLAEAIEKDLAYIRSAKEITATLHKTGDDYNLGSERELLLFRIIQEATANAIKHASPTAIDIYLNYQPEKLNVIIEDNGTGFSTNDNNKGGIGLSNMQIRADLLKGHMQIASAKDKGTTIRMEITNQPETTQI